MSYNLSHVQNLERCILFGTLKIDELSPEDKKMMEEYKQEKQKEVNDRLAVIAQDQMKRFMNSVASSLPEGSKNFKILGGNWFSFDFDNNRYMSYYYFLPNTTTPIFSCMTKIS